MNKKTIIELFILFVLLLILLFLIIRKGLIQTSFAEPKPILVSSKCDDLSSTIFNYSIRCTTEVRNDGGAGYIVLEVTVKQKNKEWTKTIRKYFEPKETSPLVLNFDEVEFLNEEPEVYFKLYPY